MHLEVIALKIPIRNSEHLIEMFVAPSYVVRALAEFLADRDDEDSIRIKNNPVYFQDFSVTVGDSKKVVAAYECLLHYNMPLENYAICKDIIQDSESYPWKTDANFCIFSKWFKNHKKNNDNDEQFEYDETL
jgi:hypothetical protein